MNGADLPQTEAINVRTASLDELPVAELVRVLVEEQRTANDAVMDIRQTLALAVEEITGRLREGGRLHYVGAGTSGRLGVLDASEMPPTFGTDPALVCAHIAGGAAALTRSVEYAEDDVEGGEREMRDHVRPGDVVVGISASGGAPFVIGAVRAARAIGAWTLGVANSTPGPLLAAADVGIVLATGAEPITGSTRMKAGTAQKILLNTLSTAVMVRLGKVYGNLMVDVVTTNRKLHERARRLVMYLVQCDEERADAALRAASGSVKIAVLMEKNTLPFEEARALLHSHHGSLRASLR